MSARLISSAAIIVLLAACATTQENPYYQHSTQYKGDTAQQNSAAAVQSAAYKAVPYDTVPHETVSYETVPYETVSGPIVVVRDMPAAHQTASQVYVPVSTVNQGQPIYTNGQTQPVYNGSLQTNTMQANTVQANTEISMPAPTDQHYGETTGTPGYHAMMAAQAAELAEQEALMASRAAEANAYSQPHTVAARSELTSTSSMFSVGESMHEVVEGNTVYSLSRSRCVSVDDIQQLNQLDRNYSIRLGDQIRLPASRC